MGWDFTVLEAYQQDFIDGFSVTLSASLLALILSLIVGTFVALARISPIRLLQGLGTAYVEFFRNTPLVIQVFFFAMGLPSIGVDISEFAAGALGLSVYTGAFIAEAIRAGIQSVPKGQMEAARSSGMSYMQAMRYVVLPQAFKIVIPPLGNQFVNLVKNSSVLAIIAGGDLLYHADLVYSQIFNVTMVYGFVALLYLVITLPLSYGVNRLERRLARSHT
ncbi:putative glutamine ABC transporter permease protein GlnM [Marinithermofilum abyssi]|uniref:Putative glutamine ABC transporter permease protein GlnM n=1 Tax=Marinithermofilum abyssi TaxID=1571185 RepID=A0A8J2VC33_9BACL|nr:amino acid ABC transporter permease [Marinithermofilum abyssi]GGE19770.1 putative glutamine ABC transporter permease protein GlnM [Marinithermofilum abyssi]